MSTSTVSGSDEEDQDNGGSITNYTSAFRPFERNSSSSTTSTSDSPDHDTDGNHVDQLRKRALNAGADDDLPSKKIKGTYSEFSMKMMASMGYIPGQGLGRENTGIVDPIQESLHKGRQGLGFNLEGLEREDVQWELEEVSYVQSPVWLPSCTLEVLTADDMEEWITFGDKKDTIEDENLYCDEEILKKILNSKSVFDNLNDKDKLEARQRSNPFETIKGVIFQNRAAMKMANMDSVFDFMFTKGFQLGPYDVLYFADVCAGPGGFSEYVLWRTGWNAKGFGFTLKDPDSGSDFKLDDFHAATTENFDPHYGANGYDGDGDVTSLDNLQAFQEYVLEVTRGEGVHFVMADGGISVEGQENIQEILLKQLVLCQYLCALLILRTGGHFVCKVFDMFTPFSVGLFYLLYRCFEQVCIFKPVTSRPANSERYVVCKGLRPHTDHVTDYLWEVNHQICQLKENKSNQDVIEIIPFHLLQSSEPFYSYVVQSNDSIGLNQIVGLTKLRYFVKNTNLQDTRQSDIRRNCLKEWKVPNTLREAPVEKPFPKEIFEEIWKKLKPADTRYDILKSSSFKECTRDNLPFLIDPYSWKWCFASGKRYIIMGLGRNRVLAWDVLSSTPSFNLRTDISLELFEGTVLEIELLSEYTGEGPGQREWNVVYIVDVIAIHDKIYADKPLKERLLLAEKLCKVLNKPCRKNYLTLKVKNYYRIEEMQTKFQELRLRRCKSKGSTPCIDVSETSFIAPVGVIFSKIIQDPWQLHISKMNKLYFFNTSNRESTFETPKKSVASYLSVISTRHIWMWSPFMSEDICGISNLTRTDILTWSHLNSLLPTNKK